MNYPLFPVFLRLEGRTCLVIGAGSVAESKIESLLLSGAVIRVVAPAASPRIEQWAGEGSLTWEKRRFEPTDLDGAFLAVSAVSSPQVRAMVCREAQARGVLCNAVDDPQHCDFFYPAVVRRGALQIAISTTGQSPALAQRLRQALEQQFGPEYGEWIERLGKARSRLLKRKADPDWRRQILHRLASRERFERFLRRRAARRPTDGAQARSQ